MTPLLQKPICCRGVQLEVFSSAFLAVATLLMFPLLAKGAPINDAFTNRVVLTGLTNFVDGSNVGATSEPGDPQPAGAYSARSVWWTWTAPVTGSMRLSTTGSSFDTVIGVYYGTTLSNLSEMASDDDSGLDGTSVVTFRAIAGESYQLLVSGFSGFTGTIKMQLASLGSPAPDWTFFDFDEEPVSAFTLARNVVVLDFFETTCGDCILETPDLLAYQQLHRRDGFQMVAVAKDHLSPSEV